MLHSFIYLVYSFIFTKEEVSYSFDLFYYLFRASILSSSYFYKGSTQLFFWTSFIILLGSASYRNLFFNLFIYIYEGGNSTLLLDLCYYSFISTNSYFLLPQSNKAFKKMDAEKKQAELDRVKTKYGINTEELKK